MKAASGRDWMIGWGIGLRAVGCAAAVLCLALPPARSSSDDSTLESPANQPKSAGNDAAATAHSGSPVVIAAPRRDTTLAPVHPPKNAAGAIASDTSDAPKGSPPRPPARPVVVPLHEASPKPPAELATAAKAAETDRPETPPADAQSVVSSRPTPGPSPLQKVAADLPPLPAPVIATMVFKGITPGTSTVEDLQKLWGEPLATKESPPRRIYKIAPYRQIQVTLADQKVASIAVELEKPFEPEPLAKQLHLESVVPVTVADDVGQPLGQSFPERGVLFSFAPQTTIVTQILIEPIDAEPFILRAEATADMHIRRALGDLNLAIRLDPQSARARALAARLLADIGRFDDALESIDQALALEPKQPSHLRIKIEILKHLDRCADSIAIATELLADANLPPLVKAQTQNELGDLLADGPDHDYKQAVELHLAAARLAGSLAGDRRAGIRRAAKRTLVEAHLGAACDIAFGVWQQKEAVAARWISRADELTKDLIQADGGDPLLRLHVARRSLDARVAIQGRWDASDWTVHAIQEGQKLIEVADDPLRRERWQWELSQSLFDIGELDQFHGFSDHSLADSQLALRLATEGSRHRQQMPADVYRLGRLYVHVGVVHAVQQRNHVAAVAWFAKALPLLDRPPPLSAGASLGLVGESFVSMGISYWETGRREDGLRLTEKGTEMMVKAVDAKLLDEGAMAIPYGNLATMHRELGHAEEAHNLAEAASRYDAPKRR